MFSVDNQPMLVQLLKPEKSVSVVAAVVAVAVVAGSAAVKKMNKRVIRGFAYDVYFHLLWQQEG